MHRYDYVALQRDFIDVADIDIVQLHPSSGPDSIASTISSTSESINEEFKSKYERLQESYKRLQRNNISLEEKLLNVSEKFNADKNLISRDLATQTQKVVEAKFTIQQLNKENFQLKSDLKVALKLLQNKPSAFVNQKLASLPQDLQTRVREHARGQEKNARNGGGQKICVPVPLTSGDQADNDEAISAAILAKVLEQRERERSKDKKFCIDIGTQTHAWIFPDTLPIEKPKSAEKSADDEMGDDQRNVADKSSDDSGDSRGFSKTTSSKSQSWESDVDSEGSETRRWNPGHVSNLLLASVIQQPPQMREGDEDSGPTSNHSSRSIVSDKILPVEQISAITTPENTQPGSEHTLTRRNGGVANKNGGGRIPRSGLQTTVYGDRRCWETALGTNVGPGTEELHPRTRFNSSDDSSQNTVRRSHTSDQIGPRIGAVTPPSITPPGPRHGNETPPQQFGASGGATPPYYRSTQPPPTSSHASSSSSLLRYSESEERTRHAGTEARDIYSGTGRVCHESGTNSRASQDSRSLVMTRSMSYSSYQTDL